MAAEALIDAGAILALLDKSDEWHVACQATFRRLRFPLLTSEAVLTELFHLVGDFPSRIEAAWKLLQPGIVSLASIEHSELSDIKSLMLRYSDRPMDFADATLVHLAARESIHVIFTLDQGDFSVYRIGGKQRFQVLPIERPR
jgi:predicted nucleic acid-binding protein